MYALTTIHPQGHCSCLPRLSKTEDAVVNAGACKSHESRAASLTPSMQSDRTYDYVLMPSILFMVHHWCASYYLTAVGASWRHIQIRCHGYNARTKARLCRVCYQKPCSKHYSPLHPASQSKFHCVRSQEAVTGGVQRQARSTNANGNPAVVCVLDAQKVTALDAQSMLTCRSFTLGRSCEKSHCWSRTS